VQHDTEWATIGTVVASFGLRGELKVHALTDIPNRFAELGAVYLGPDHIRYLIKGARPYKGDMVILKLAGIDDANAAETLRDAEITIPLSQLAKLPADSYYQHDIIGLQVVTLDGRNVGQIVDIMATGSNDVYVIKSADGRQILIPAIKDVIKRVDLLRKMMYIDPIVGLLDDNEAVYTDDLEEAGQSAQEADT
jgi:16S rRNA processing protein RimM